MKSTSSRSAPFGLPAAAALRLRRWPDLLVPLLLAGFSLIMAVRSKGFFELDELTHFLKSREAWSDWRGILDIWGRPLCTALYAIGAPLGLAASRAIAVLVTVATADGTIRLGRLLLPLAPQGRRYCRPLLWLLLFAQPLFLLHSFAVMTEMLLACLLVWAAVALAAGFPVRAGALIGLAPLARPEGWVAVACWPVVLRLAAMIGPAPSAGLALRRRGKPHADIQLPAAVASVAAAAAPTLLWWLAGWWAFGSSDWWQSRWPWPVHSPYGRTGGQFLTSLSLALAVWMFVPLAAGARFVWGEYRRRSRHAARALLFVLAPLFGYVALHGLLALLGLFGSLSLPRYYVAVAPFIALLAWLGIEAHTAPAGLQSSRLWPASPWGAAAPALSLLPAALLLLAGQLPVARNAQFQPLDEAVAWVRQIQRAQQRKPAVSLPVATQWGQFRVDPDPARVVAAHPYVQYRLGVPQGSAGRRMAPDSAALQGAPAGTVVIVENVIWEYDGFAEPARLRAWGYEPVRRWDTEPESALELFLRLKLPASEHLRALLGKGIRIEVWVKRR